MKTINLHTSDSFDERLERLIDNRKGLVYDQELGTENLDRNSRDK